MDYHYGGTRYEDDPLMNEKGIGPSKDNKNSSKRGLPCTRGTAMSFGFRRRPTSGIPVPTATTYSSTETVPSLHQRSKSAGPAQSRVSYNDVGYDATNSSSGRSTPRLPATKKESSSGIAVSQTNRFGYRQATAAAEKQKHPNYEYLGSSHNASHCNQERQRQVQAQSKAPRYGAPISKYRVAPMNNASVSYSNNITQMDMQGRPSGIPEPVNRYTLHTSHLPLPQYAVRMKDVNSKVAKTATNQSRKVSASKAVGSYRSDSATDDSGVGSHFGYPNDKDRSREVDFYNYDTSAERRRFGRSRNVRMTMNSQQSIDVRRVRDEYNTVTEISVIPLQKPINSSLSAGPVRQRMPVRVTEKDNRYTDLTMSMSTTSSEGYDERSGEEKVYKDRSHSEKVASAKSDVSPLSSDDPEYGHGEAMADEYSLSSSDECQHYTTSQQLKTMSSTSSKNGTLPKNPLRSVLLTIEDPAFAAVADTSTSLIDDETLPVDSLLDSPTTSITQSDGKPAKKDLEEEQIENFAEHDPGAETPTNTSNSLSLSEGREFFDDEIADQPGLIFDDNSRKGTAETQSSITSHGAAENSHTLVEPSPKSNAMHGKSSRKESPHARRLSRAGSIDTLSPCESIDSDDLMLDYERSDVSSHEENHRRLDTSSVHPGLGDSTVLSELQSQGEELMGTQQQTNLNNSVNNNAVNNTSTDNNNHSTGETGIGSGRSSKFLRNRFGADSPRSLDSMRNQPVSNSLRTTRNIHSPNLDSDDESSIRVDIVSIKSTLLKLKRVLQEEEATGSYHSSTKNGLFCNTNEENITAHASTSPDSIELADELADLRRQLVFLQGQVEDKDRTIQRLQHFYFAQFQMSKLQGSNGETQSGTSSSSSGSMSPTDTCNAATQTEKTRAVSAGPSLLQSLPQDGIVAPLVSFRIGKPCGLE